MAIQCVSTAFKSWVVSDRRVRAVCVAACQSHQQERQASFWCKMTMCAVLSSLAEEKRCQGTSRLEKIEELTRLFLFPADGSSEAAQDVLVHEDESGDEELEGRDADAKNSVNEEAIRLAAAAAAVPSYARPLIRSRSPVSQFQRGALEAPELPYLAPKLLRSPAKNALACQRQKNLMQWSMLRADYDADAVLRSMSKSAGKSDDNIRTIMQSSKRSQISVSSGAQLHSPPPVPVTCQTPQQCHSSPIKLESRVVSYRHPLSTPRQRRVQVQNQKQTEGQCVQIVPNDANVVKDRSRVGAVVLVLVMVVMMMLMFMIYV